MNGSSLDECFEEYEAHPDFKRTEDVAQEDEAAAPPVLNSSLDASFEEYEERPDFEKTEDVAQEPFSPDRLNKNMRESSEGRDGAPRKFMRDMKKIAELKAYVLKDDGDKELEDVLAHNKFLSDMAKRDLGGEQDKADVGRLIAEELYGDDFADPGVYFNQLGKPMPMCETRSQAYAALYDDFAADARKERQDLLRRRAEYQEHKKVIDQTVADVVAGLMKPEEVRQVLSPEQQRVYEDEFDATAIAKAHGAMMILKDVFKVSPEEGLRRMVNETIVSQMTAMLSDEGDDGPVMNEAAYAFFKRALFDAMEKVKEDSGDEYKFLHNLRLSLFNPVQKRAESIELGVRSALATQDLGAAHIAEGLFGGLFSDESKKKHQAFIDSKHDEIIELYKRFSELQSNDQSKLMGMLSKGQELGNETRDDADFMAKTVNCLGTGAGDTAPFFIPYAGPIISFAGSFDDARNRSYYDGLPEGTAEWSAFVDAATKTGVEMIPYGKILGRGGKFVGAGRLVDKFPSMKAAKAEMMGSFWKSALVEMGGNAVEEVFLEPTAEAVIQWGVRNKLAPLAGLDVGKKYVESYWEKLKEGLEPEQLLATVILMGAVTGTQGATIKRAAENYTMNVDLLCLQGIGKEDAQRISAIEDAKERMDEFKKAAEAAKVDPERAQANIAEGVNAFKSLNEVKAHYESQAYEVLSQAYHLPKVEERLDKPGQFVLTSFDPVTGEKTGSQNVSEKQLIALFGSVYTADQRKRVREAQAAIVADSFVRAAQATGDVVVQAMPGLSDGLSAAAKVVRNFGSESVRNFEHVARMALNELKSRVRSGMSKKKAMSKPFEVLSPHAALGSMMSLDKVFNERVEAAKGAMGAKGIDAASVFQLPTAEGSPAKVLFLLAEGQVSARDAAGALFEWKLNEVTQGDPARLQAVGSLMQGAQAEMHKLGFDVNFIKTEGVLSDKDVVASFSNLATSHLMMYANSLPLPQWVKGFVEFHMTALEDTAGLMDVGYAWQMARQEGAISAELEDVLRDAGYQVGDVLASAKVEQEDVKATRDADGAARVDDSEGLMPPRDVVSEQEGRPAKAKEEPKSDSDVANKQQSRKPTRRLTGKKKQRRGRRRR